MATVKTKVQNASKKGYANMKKASSTATRKPSATSNVGRTASTSKTQMAGIIRDATQGTGSTRANAQKKYAKMTSSKTTSARALAQKKPLTGATSGGTMAKKIAKKLK